MSEREFEHFCGAGKLCTDSQAVNAIAVNYHHLIPRLDDMLDELYGAVIFNQN